jgi:hypothetical protein
MSTCQTCQLQRLYVGLVCVCVCVYLAQAKEYSIEQLVILAQVEQVDPKVQGSLVDLLSFGIAEQHPTVKVMALQ